MDVLSIVAYEQPITCTEISNIRGIDDNGRRDTARYKVARG